MIFKFCGEEKNLTKRAYLKNEKVQLWILFLDWYSISHTGEKENVREQQQRRERENRESGSDVVALV